MHVKFCGFTQLSDINTAVQLGVDAVGLVFYPPSPRFVDVKTAQRIVAALPPFVMVVGLFMNAEPATVRTLLESVRIDLLQFHGDEEPDACAAFGWPYLKAVPMGAGHDAFGRWAEGFGANVLTHISQGDEAADTRAVLLGGANVLTKKGNGKVQAILGTLQ